MCGNYYILRAELLEMFKVVQNSPTPCSGPDIYKHKQYSFKINSSYVTYLKPLTVSFDDDNC